MTIGGNNNLMVMLGYGKTWTKAWTFKVIYA